MANFNLSSLFKGSSFTKIELLPPPLTNGYMDIAGQHLLLSFNSTYYIYDLSAPNTTPSPKVLTTESHAVTDKITPSSELPKEDRRSGFLLAFSDVHDLPAPTAISRPLTPTPGFWSVSSITICSMGLVMALLLAALIYVSCAKKRSDENKEENLEQLRPLSETLTQRTLLSSDTG